LNKLIERNRIQKTEIQLRLVFEWTVQAICALEYLHSDPIHTIHCDIKPANILLANDDRIKLADLGVARLVENTVRKVRTETGTETYMSPEMLKAHKISY
jgi:serine/threonine protein kinase